MKDEIKEILDYLGNDKNYNCDNNDGSYYLELPYREAHELKDCITNLQEEIERLKDFYRNNYFKYGNKVYDGRIVLKQRDDYKSINEKALDKLYCYGEVFDSKILQQFQKEMENILQGEDKQ